MEPRPGQQVHVHSLFPQTSLNKLLEALGKAEPFFIRCIRSNAEKVSAGQRAQHPVGRWSMQGSDLGPRLGVKAIGRTWD